MGDRVKAVAGINESEGEVALLIEEGFQDKGGPGGRMGRDDFAEVTREKGERIRHRRVLRRRHRSPLSRRKLLAKPATELFDGQDAQKMFTRTLF